LGAPLRGRKTAGQIKRIMLDREEESEKERMKERKQVKIKM
jgi:hypothetical protein